jgi:hypothetical protein
MALTATPLADIVGQANPEPDALLHVVPTTEDTVFTWDYDRTREPLSRLYDKAKQSQWDANDLPWDTEVDQEKMAHAEAALMGGFSAGIDVQGTAFEHWDEAEWLRFGIEAQNWMLSNFLHGEQGALLCTAKLIDTVPWIDAKFYGATQVMDEARHVEVFARYLDEKLSGHYPINFHLRSLLDDIVSDSRWDVTYLGMQVLVEGMALAAFGMISQIVEEPLLKMLLRKVMVDEARHVAFGVLSLAEVYDGLNAAEIRERQEFAYEATMRMRDRFAMQEVWERFDVAIPEATRLIVQRPERQMFQQMLFAKIVPNCSKLGLLDAGDGWLRERYTELGIIGFESYASGDDEVDDR